MRRPYFFFSACVFNFAIFSRRLAFSLRRLASARSSRGDRFLAPGVRPMSRPVWIVPTRIVLRLNYYIREGSASSAGGAEGRARNLDGAVGQALDDPKPLPVRTTRHPVRLELGVPRGSGRARHSAA